MFKLRGNLEAVRNSKTLEECMEVGVGWGYKCQHSLRNRTWLGPLSSLGDPVFSGSHHKYNLSGLGSFLLTLPSFCSCTIFLSLHNKLTHSFTDNENTSIRNIHAVFVGAEIRQSLSGLSAQSVFADCKSSFLSS